MPKEGSAFHPPYVTSSHQEWGGLGAPEGEQDSAHGPSCTARLPCSRQCCLLGRRRESCARWAGGRGGDRTQQGQGEGRAKCHILPQWVLFQFLLFSIKHPLCFVFCLGLHLRG